MQLDAKIKVAFAGTPEFAKISLQALFDAGFDVVAVFTQPDKKSGRGQKVSASAVKQLAQAHGVDVYQPTQFNQTALQVLKDSQADVLVVVAYGMILPQNALDVCRFGAINVHGSYLPRWRGAAPIQRAILAGDDTTGISIMKMVRKLDAGDVLLAQSLPILSDDNAQSLHDKLAHLGAQLLVQALHDLPILLANALPQDESLVTYAHKISSDDGRIDWQQGASYIERQVRAVNAYAFLQGVRIKILGACVATNAPPLAVGEIKITEDGAQVGCGMGVLYISAMQWAGGKSLSEQALVQKLQAQQSQTINLQNGFCFT